MPKSQPFKIINPQYPKQPTVNSCRVLNLLETTVHQLHTCCKPNLKSPHSHRKTFTDPYIVSPWPRPINKLHSKLNKLFYALSTNHSQQRFSTHGLHQQPSLTFYLHIKNTNCKSRSIHYRNHNGGSQHHSWRGSRSHQR